MPEGKPQHTKYHPHRLGYHRNYIRRYRLQLNLTQEQLAKRLGTKPYVVMGWERGWHIPRTQNLLRLARELNTLAESLYWDLYAPRSPGLPVHPDDHAFPRRR